MSVDRPFLGVTTKRFDSCTGMVKGNVHLDGWMLLNSLVNAEHLW